MKKLWMGLLGCMVLFGAAAAQQTDPRLYRGELEKAQDVIALMEQREFLPLYLNEFDSFNGEDEKQLALDFALEQVKGSDSYLTNCNAAVVYATASSEEGVDYSVRVSEKEAQQAVIYAGAAIKKSPESPYMYLLRGQVLFEHAVDYSIGDGSTELTNRARAEQALEDFEKVEELNPVLAPYGNMAVLAEVLGDEVRMEKYQLEDQLAQKKGRSSVRQSIIQALKNVWK